MRIALFTYSTKPRGGVIHTIELAEALQRLGHQVCIYALDKDGTGFARPLLCNYRPVPALPVVGDTDALIRQRIGEFVDLLSQEPLPYDCYHAQDCISANALSALREQGRIPAFVRTVHHIEDFNSPYLRQCQERSIREPDLCLCVSDYWQQQLRQQYGLDAPRVLNGVDTRRFSAEPDGTEADLKQQLGLRGKPIYLTVGGIEPRKNSIRLLQAFSQVRAELPQAQWVIAGGATLFDYQTYRDAFFAEADRLGIIPGEALILPGVLADAQMPALYRVADAFVFPSVKEGWGLVVLEAIACGLPVITADQPPFTEFLTPDQALLINPYSVDAIAQAMVQIQQPEVSQQLRQKSQSAIVHYTWEASARLHLMHYGKMR